MDPNNDDQSNQQPQDAPQTDANQPVQSQQQDDQTQQADQNSDQGQQTESPVNEPTDQTQPADQAQPENQPADNPAVQEDTYIEDVGGSVIDLLDDIDESDDLVKIVAKEMRLDDQRVRAILSGLLAKIDQNQLTIEELALIMAAPVVDEVDDQPQQ